MRLNPATVSISMYPHILSQLGENHTQCGEGLTGAVVQFTGNVPTFQILCCH